MSIPGVQNLHSPFAVPYNDLQRKTSTNPDEITPNEIPPVKSLSELTVDDLLDEFEFLGSWEDRCEYLIDLGFELPDMPDEEKTELNKVRGCQSNVWMTIRPVADEAGEPRLEIHADSDAMIVKGLIAVLLTVYDGRTPREAMETDVAAVFTKLGLDRHLSSARKNGLAGMVRRIREEAARLAAASISGTE